jgi:DNA-binding NtrC family response regulator
MTASRSATLHAEPPPVVPDMKQVLLVEDERRLREVLIANIREMGMEATGVGSAEQGLHALDRQTFAMAVIDLNLPGMGGMELVAAIHRRWPATQVIVLTGFGDLAAAKRAIRLDVVDFLTKPCGMDELEQALSRARNRFRERWIANQSDAESPPREPHAAKRMPMPQPAADAAAPEGATTPSAAAAKPGDGGAAQTTSIEGVERELIYAALARNGGNREAAAADLGISVRKLYYRLQQYHQAKSAATETSE